MDASSYHRYSPNGTASDDVFKVPLYGAIVLCALSLAFFLLGLFSNFALLSKLCRRPPWKFRSLDVLLCSLAVADLLFVAIGLPIQLHDNLFEYWHLGGVVCKLRLFATVLAYLISPLLLVVAAALLCGAKRNAAFDGRRYTVRACVALAALWLLAGLAAALSAYGGAAHAPAAHWLGWRTDADGDQGPMLCITYATVYGLVEFLVLVFQFVIYAVFSCVLCGGNRAELPEGAPPAEMMKTRRDTRAIIRMVFTIAMIKTVAWLPFQLVVLVNFQQFFFVSSDLVWAIMWYWSLVTSVVNYFVCKAFGYFIMAEVAV